MTPHRHPYENADYILTAEGDVRVVDHDCGREGVFALGGRWLSGELRHADNHFIRYVYDCTAPVKAIAPTLR